MKIDVTTPADETPGTTPDGEGFSPVEPEAVDTDVVELEGEPIDAEEAEEAPASDGVFSMADIEAARADAKAANERLVRLQAEWDNFRKRTAREREDERARACESLVTKMLPVVDDLERSLDHAANSKPEGEFGEFVDGIRAVYQKLVDVFERQGVEAIDPAGKEFDMNEHQAVAHIEDPSIPASTVRDVYQKGYRMGGRIIRPAMVTVSKGGPERRDEADGDASAE